MKTLEQGVKNVKSTNKECVLEGRYLILPGIFIFNFENISPLILLFLMRDLNR